MVLKRSKHGFNTGSTLRKHALEIVRGYSKPSFICRFDADELGSRLEDLWNRYDENATEDFDYEIIETYRLLEQILDVHDSLGAYYSSLSYSVSKHGRWEGLERMKTLLARLSTRCSDLQLNLSLSFVKEFGFWRSSEVISCENPAGKFINTKCPKTTDRSRPMKNTSKRFRGVQRKQTRVVTDDYSEEPGDWVPYGCTIHIEYRTCEIGTGSKIFSTHKVPKELEYRPRKKKNKDFQWNHELLQMKGVSSSEYVSHAFDEPTRESHDVWSSRSLPRRDENEDETLKHSVFLTEIGGYESKETATTSKKTIDDTKNERFGRKETCLWKIIRDLSDDSLIESSAKITFMNCKTGCNCSRSGQTAMPLPPGRDAEQKAVAGNECNSRENMNENPGQEKNRCQAINRCQSQCHSPSVSKNRKRSKKKKHRKSSKKMSRDVWPQDKEISTILVKVKLKSVQEYLLEKEFGSNYRESRCFPRRFWINLTDTVSPSCVKIPTETHPTAGIFPGTKSDFQILVLFSQVSLTDASDSQQDNAFAQFSLKVKMQTNEQEKVTFDQKLSVSIRNHLIYPLTRIVNIVADVAQNILNERATLAMRDPPASIMAPVQNNRKETWNWMSAVHDWKYSVYTLDQVAQELRKTSLPSPRLGKLESRSPSPISSVDFRNWSGSCYTCGRLYGSVERYPGSIAHAVSPRNEKLKSDFEFVLNPSCLHCICFSCFRKLTNKILQNCGVPDRCQVTHCSTKIDPVVILDAIPLAIFWNYLESSMALALSEHPQWKLCPKCRQAVKLSGSDILLQSVVVECTCGSDWCFQCLGEPHWPATCAESDIYRTLLHQEGLLHSDRLCLHSVFIQSVPDRSCPHPSDQENRHTAMKQPAARRTGNDVFTASMPSNKVRSFSKLPPIQSAKKTDRNATDLRPNGLLKPLNPEQSKGIPKMAASFKIDIRSNSKTKLSVVGTSTGFHARRTLSTGCLARNKQDARYSDTALNRTTECGDSNDRDLCEIKLCLKCLDLVNSQLELPRIFREQRKQTRASACNTLLPLLFYRSAINHRYKRLHMTQTECHQKTKFLMDQIKKSSFTKKEKSQGVAFMRSTHISSDLGLPVATGSRIPAGMDDDITKRRTRVFAGVKMAMKNDTDSVLFLCIFEFIQQAHVLMENVYVKLFNNPNHEKLPSVLQELLKFESTLESIYQVTEAKGPASSSIVTQLKRLFDEGQSARILVAKSAEDL